mmetsp:Transcript_34039/g.72388  ORF Transcript_34039/g.72388 Transcript_34039/m.72388 type:complete len:81 (+) Transcript_34039:571-813(+)
MAAGPVPKLIGVVKLAASGGGGPSTGVTRTGLRSSARTAGPGLLARPEAPPRDPAGLSSGDIGAADNILYTAAAAAGHWG